VHFPLRFERITDCSLPAKNVICNNLIFNLTRRIVCKPFAFPLVCDMILIHSPDGTNVYGSRCTEFDGIRVSRSDIARWSNALFSVTTLSRNSRTLKSLSQ